MTPRSVDGAASQLRRLLIAIPALADDQPHRIADVAELVGVSTDTLARDLRTLVTRFDAEPGGFMEGVRLAFASDTVQLESTLFRRPMGLTPSELGALELGLAALERELPPHEAAVATRARRRVANAGMGLDAESRRSPVHASTFPTSERAAEYLSELRTAIAARKKVELVYRSGGAPDGSARNVHPYGLVYARGHWYLVAHCEKSQSIRIFRVDRMLSVGVLNEPAQIPDHLELEAKLVGGRALLNQAEEVLRVRYSATIARWIAEHGKTDEQSDGSVIVEHALLDDEWAVRHVLQYGPEAEVLAPARIQDMMREMLVAILSEG